jgi:ubiquitin carboxyl-terminal hydrolase 9/24
MVMKGLRDAVRMSYNPKNFCKVFTNFDGSPINPGEQMDADEFFNNLMDKLEAELKKSNQENVIKRTFGGTLVQEIISSECDHRSTRESPFLTINLEVKGISGIAQSLEKLISGEILDGENKYKCETCEKKVKAMKRESIKKLPNKLILVLKRFDYQFETHTKIKLNSYCEFPEKIDLRKYTQEYLNEDPSQNRKPDNYYNFSLRGVNIHRGTAEYGHYYSLIK